ncbi:transcriptional regulator, MarR family [Paraglaciecola sp. T6c]|uniref:MarR family winged helix-turn-helix transcriptional regulator n=1 Tax=Pseudoalteromonas atlantica (strain T6c / ATCC BAA-1087) TaxID=3042615 RepID=UPI00005C6C65|nr:MarR family transcriptional regulator [Paraglaciecola sp. T6c]ABG39648.1 transcriptional regulator, MarR family [Paraglaciecola sp. T6c]
MPKDDDILLDLNQFFPYQLSILAQQVTEFIAKIYEKHGLTRTDWRVLAAVGFHGEISARDICKFTRLEKMPVSRAIAKLIRAGLLLQHPGSLDRRTNVLNLTSEGAKVHQHIIPLVKAQEERLLEGLSTQEREQLKALTVKLGQQLEVATK